MVQWDEPASLSALTLVLVLGVLYFLSQQVQLDLVFSFCRLLRILFCPGSVCSSVIWVANS